MTARALAAAGLAVAATLLPASGAAAPVTATAERGAEAGSVTLITGDRVELLPTGEPRVVPAAGRAAARYRITRDASHLTVLPLDAAPLIAEGRLDPRLFDVTALRDAGFADDASPDLGLIVRRDPAARSSAPGLRQERALPSVGGAAVRAAKADVPELWRSLVAGGSGLDKVWLNGRREVTLEHSVPRIGAPAAWQAGFTGAGVTVAVLDTGIDASHPDLAGRVTEARNFTEEPDGDQIGHGTHVASTIAGVHGVAPAARLLDGKVCGDRDCSEDAILAGMEWAAGHAKVVNMSLSGSDGAHVDPLEAAVEELSAAHGTLFVTAAGNAGPGAGTVGSPASADAALAVGAVDRSDGVADFSSRGPRVGDGGLKPEVSAPGVDIIAAQAAGTELGEPTGDGHVALSGTSMATPHVAGAAAILAQQHPDWRGDRVKATLMSSAKPLGSAFETGAGRVDVARAVTQHVTAAPVSVSFGLATWPHEDDPVQSEQVTYRNDGTSEAVLSVTAPAPFTVTPSSVTVPARGTAAVTVSVDTRAADVPIGTHSGLVLATGGDVSVSTPVGVEKEPERYEVSLTHIGRDGAAPATHLTFFDRVGDCGDDVNCGGFTQGSGSTSSLRLPPGEYVLGELSSVDAEDTSLLMQPKVVVDRDLALTLDARAAKPVDVRAPRGEAVNADVAIGFNVERPDALFVYAMGTGWHQPPLYVGAVPGSPPTRDRVHSVMNAKFAEPGPAGDFVDSPYVYNVAADAADQVFDGVRLAPTAEEFAKVDASYAAVTDQPRLAETDYSGRGTAAPAWFGFPPISPGLRSSRVPFRLTEYYLAAGLSWWSVFDHWLPNGGPDDNLHLYVKERQVYRPGRTYHVDWNRGVLGPAFAPIPPDGAPRGAVRTGDAFAMGLVTMADATHAHDPRSPSGTGRLLRDGQVVVEWPRAGFVWATLPPGEATYRLEHTVRQNTAVSTEIASRWTFRSGHTSAATPLPLMVVRFAPSLDIDNHAPAGRFTVPVAVHRQPGAADSPVAELTVEVSYDDGATWRRTKVTGKKVVVDNPAGGAVSLRATVTDRAGNRAEQTILRAYLVRGAGS